MSLLSEISIREGKVVDFDDRQDTVNVLTTDSEISPRTILSFVLKLGAIPMLISYNTNVAAAGLDYTFLQLRINGVGRYPFPDWSNQQRGSCENPIMLGRAIELPQGATVSVVGKQISGAATYAATTRVIIHYYEIPNA